MTSGSLASRLWACFGGPIYLLVEVLGTAGNETARLDSNVARPSMEGQRPQMFSPGISTSLTPGHQGKTKKPCGEVFLLALASIHTFPTDMSPHTVPPGSKQPASPATRTAKCRPREQTGPALGQTGRWGGRARLWMQEFWLPALGSSPQESLLQSCFHLKNCSSGLCPGRLEDAGSAWPGNSWGGVEGLSPTAAGRLAQGGTSLPSSQDHH